MGPELLRRVFGGHAAGVSRQRHCAFGGGEKQPAPPTRWEGFFFGRYREIRAHKLAAAMATWGRIKPVIILPFAIITIALLVAADYPAGRIWAVAGLEVAIQAILIWSLVKTIRTRDVSRAQPPEAMTLLFFAVLAITGGTASPFIPMILMQVAGSAVVFGRSRRTLLTGASVVAQVVVLFLLPPFIVGPTVIEPYREILAGVTVIFTALVLVFFISSLSQSAHEAGEMLESMREDLVVQLLERTRSLETVSSRVAHELKNPLAAVKAIVQLLQRSASEGSRERLEVLHSEIARMERIIADYMTFSRPLQDLTPEQVEIDRLAHEVLAVLEARAADAGVVLVHEGDAITIQGDPLRLKEALLNLVSNALEATPTGGRVRVGHLQRLDGGAEITVTDSGRGMAADVLGRIGTPFYTTREAGTGLGVLLAKRVIGQHGGEVCYESELGRGTTVTVRLPSVLPACAQSPKSEWCPDLAFPGPRAGSAEIGDPNPARVALLGPDPAWSGGQGED